MSKLNQGARRLKVVLEKHKPAEVAVALDCTTTTVYNLLGGAAPSLPVALAAERVYKIAPKLWEVFE